MSKYNVYRILSYIKLREQGLTLEEILSQSDLDEATAYCYEIGYQCYLVKALLDCALDIVKSFVNDYKSK